MKDCSHVWFKNNLGPKRGSKTDVYECQKCGRSTTHDNGPPPNGKTKKETSSYVEASAVKKKLETAAEGTGLALILMGVLTKFGYVFSPKPKNSKLDGNSCFVYSMTKSGSTDDKVDKALEKAGFETTGFSVSGTGAGDDGNEISYPGTDYPSAFIDPTGRKLYVFK